MKYRIKHHDTTLLFFTPFAFLNMDGTDIYNVEKKIGWWIFGKWEVVYKAKDIIDAYVEYFKLKYNLEVEEEIEFPHNRKKNRKVWCKLNFHYNPQSVEYRYTVGYKPENYARYYHVCYSPDSYEDALIRLINDLKLKKIINKNG